MRTIIICFISNLLFLLTLTAQNEEFPKAKKLYSGYSSQVGCNQYHNISNHYLLASVVRSYWRNNTWNQSEKTIYEYNKYNLLVSSTFRNYFRYKWLDSLCVKYTYDSLNRKIEVLYQAYNENQWVNTARERSEIWSSENKQMFHEEFINGAWSVSWAETVSQSALGESRTIMMPNSGGYYTIGRSYEYYNKLGNVTESSFYWVNMTSEILNGKDVYYYDSLNRLTKKVSFTSSILGLEEARREIYEYNDIMKTSLKTLYQNKDSSWQPVEYYLSEYDENNNEIKVTKQVFKDSIWINELLEEKSYEKMLKNEDIPSLVDKYVLFQNYPNPFNPSTKIRFELPVKSHVKLLVYNILGQNVACLTNAIQQAGTYEYIFEASGLASGIYFYRLITPQNTITKPMILTK